MGLENPLHILILLVVLLLLFGAKRLPEMGRNLGTGMRDFKDAISGNDKPEAHPASQLSAHDAPTPESVANAAKSDQVTTSA